MPIKTNHQEDVLNFLVINTPQFGQAVLKHGTPLLCGITVLQLGQIQFPLICGDCRRGVPQPLLLLFPNPNPILLFL